MVQQFSIRFHKHDLLDALSDLFGSAALDKQMLEPSIRRVQLQTVSFHWVKLFIDKSTEKKLSDRSFTLMSQLAESMYHRSEWD